MKGRNLYERNLYACAQQHYLKYNNRLTANLIYYSNKLFFHNIYFKYIEIPITTKCTLNCKDCANLIQFYQKPYHIESADIINDVRNLSKIAKEILLLRVLGGEPLLHPELFSIIKQILELKNIKHIQIVTNGTLLFDEKTLNILRDNKRVSVDISNYEEKSIRKKQLIEQLKSNHIRYFTQEERIFWTSQADCSCRKRNESQMIDVLSKCRMDCISLLDGKLHLCPRSSHGMDLGIIVDNRADYYNLREMKSVEEGKNSIYKLLNKKSITACNYCDIFRWEELDKVKAAEQIGKKEAADLLRKYQCENS